MVQGCSAVSPSPLREREKEAIVGADLLSGDAQGFNLHGPGLLGFDSLSLEGEGRGEGERSRAADCRDFTLTPALSLEGRGRGRGRPSSAPTFSPAMRRASIFMVQGCSALTPSPLKGEGE